MDIITADRVRECIEIGYEKAKILEMGGKPKPGDAVWFAIQGAMETLHRLPDREAGWLYSQRSCWPEIAHDHVDKLDAYVAELDRLKMGEGDTRVSMRTPPPSPKAIARMELIFDLHTGWHRYLKGRNKPRDWKVICRLCQGQRVAAIASEARCDKRTVYDIRSRQLEHIAVGLRGDFSGAISAIKKAA